MKILYFSPHPNIGLHTQSGPGTHIREVIAAFRKEGHEVQTLIMGGKEPAQGQNQTAPPTGLKQRVKPLIPPYLWQSLKDRNLLKFDRYAKQELIQKIQEFQPDLIYERGYYMMTSGVEAAKEMGIKHCLEMNAPYPEEKLEMEGKGIHDRKASHREKQQVESTDLLVVVSSALKDYFLKRTNIDPNRVLVTPNAIRESFMEEGKDQDIRSSLGWGGQTIVGFVGSIFPYHGVDRLLEAFAIANKENTKLLIVGDGAILEQLKERSQNLNIADQVHFSGKVNHSEVASYLRSMDICVMANSNWYGSPVKIFEYGAFEKCVIAPNTIPVQDVMVNEKDGLLINNEEELLTALEVVLNDSDKRNQLAVNWHKKVVKKHQWHHVGKSVIEKLETVENVSLPKP